MTSVGTEKSDIFLVAEVGVRVASWVDVNTNVVSDFFHCLDFGFVFDNCVV